MAVMRAIWYWINSTFGGRVYSRGGDGKCYVKEGFNKPEELSEHLKRYHPEEYKEMVEGDKE